MHFPAPSRERYARMALRWLVCVRHYWRANARTDSLSENGRTGSAHPGASVRHSIRQTGLPCRPHLGQARIDIDEPPSRCGCGVDIAATAASDTAPFHAPSLSLDLAQAFVI